jgi:hypothetical protein
MLKRFWLLPGLAAVLMTLRGESEEPKTGAEGHALLKKFEGTWESSAVYTAMPGAEPMKGKGTLETKALMGGKYYQTSGAIDLGGLGSAQLATMGYNMFSKKYFMVTFIGETGGYVVTEGVADKEGKVLTMEGAEALPDGQEMKVKVVLRRVSDTEYVMEYWFPGADGKLSLAAEFTQKKK